MNETPQSQGQPSTETGKERTWWLHWCPEDDAPRIYHVGMIMHECRGLTVEIHNPLTGNEERKIHDALPVPSAIKPTVTANPISALDDLVADVEGKYRTVSNAIYRAFSIGLKSAPPSSAVSPAEDEKEFNEKILPELDRIREEVSKIDYTTLPNGPTPHPHTGSDSTDLRDITDEIIKLFQRRGFMTGRGFFPVEYSKNQAVLKDEIVDLLAQRAALIPSDATKKTESVLEAKPESVRKAIERIRNELLLTKEDDTWFAKDIALICDAASPVPAASPWIREALIEGLEWALDTLDMTDKYLKKIDPEYHRLDQVADREAKTKARQVLAAARGLPIPAQKEKE